MMITRRVIARCIVFGGAVLAPLFAWAHANEFLIAGLEVKPGRVRLEITADYEGNPMFQSAEEAREAVQTSLRIKTGVTTHRLDELAPLVIAETHDWSAEMPASLRPPADSQQQHRLIHAVWDWPTDAPQVAFEVPEGNAHDVVLWTRDAEHPENEPRWVMLIEGESTRQVPVPGQTPVAVAMASPAGAAAATVSPWFRFRFWLVAGGLVLVATFPVWHLASKRPARRSRHL